MRTFTHKFEEKVLAPVQAPTDRDVGMARLFFRVRIERLGRQRDRGEVTADDYDWLIEWWGTCIALAMWDTSDASFPQEFVDAFGHRYEGEEMFLAAVAERALRVYSKWATEN